MNVYLGWVTAQRTLSVPIWRVRSNVYAWTVLRKVEVSARVSEMWWFLRRWIVTLPCIILKNCQTYCKNHGCEHRKILNFFWLFLNIMHEKVIRSVQDQLVKRYFLSLWRIYRDPIASYTTKDCRYGDINFWNFSGKLFYRISLGFAVNYLFGIR